MYEPRRMGPLAADHPVVAGIPETNIAPKVCQVCGEGFAAGDYVTLLPIDPNAVGTVEAHVVHWGCA